MPTGPGVGPSKNKSRLLGVLPIGGILERDSPASAKHCRTLGVQANGNPASVFMQDEHFIYKLWAPRPVITTGGYDRESSLKVAEETGQLIGFGRPFLSNPDLPFRLRHNIPLNEPEFDPFFAAKTEKGYTTYPFSEEFLKSKT
ncbi:hypothetical protein C8Q78DRAFT_1150405 [Trametes maxima]|nr:hypothetical protein C8Q78DRAFT_1150405 [Trametes maxima]